MTASAPHRLILVEGLTGAGKSTLAHFIAHQYRANGIPARWIWEETRDHPVGPPPAEPHEDGFIETMLARWEQFAAAIQAGDAITVVEASVFNGLIRWLFESGSPPDVLVDCADRLFGRIAALDPALIYFTQRDVAQALERIFAARGPTYREFLVRYTTTRSYARQRGLAGAAGMVALWEDFVRFTDALYDRFPGRKLRLDNTAAAWNAYNRQALDFLGLPAANDRIAGQDAARYVGTYVDAATGSRYVVRWAQGRLAINLFANAPNAARLVPLAHDTFAVERTYLEIAFTADERGDIGALVVGGRDGVWTEMVGTRAIKQPDPDTPPGSP